MMRTRLIGGEILPTQGYRDRGKYWCGLLLGLVLFLGCWSILFSEKWWAHIRYGVLGSIAICHRRESVVSWFVGRNQQPMVPGVWNPDSSPWAFHREGDWSHSLNRSQNRYSCVTVGTATGFGGKPMGLKPPWSWLGISQWYPPSSPWCCSWAESTDEG
jgi:hypothetical protein